MNGSTSDCSSISSDNPELCELKERIDIVERYDKGDNGQTVDDWENPNFEVYKLSDRYGFLREETTSNAELFEAKAKELELLRERKWLKMLGSWEKYRYSIKLRKRIYKGIPEKLRPKVWGQLLELDKLKQPLIYEQLRLRARLLSKDLKQIDLDINRTYRNHILFRRRYDVKQRDLFHVLAAYAIYNTDVGYCQGMSQIAALLLMYFAEEDAFWALHALMSDDKHAMHGFFVPGFPKLLRFQQHHDKILEKMMPKLKKHLDKQEVSSGLYTTKWFFQCFLDRVPFTLALRLWDNFLLDGDIVLTGGAYCILKMHQKILYKMNFEQVMDLLQVRLESYFGYKPDDVIKHLRNCIVELKRSKLLRPRTSPDINELPGNIFGAVLNQPIDRAVSSVLSRKLMRSNAPSISQSMPVTPQNRSPTNSRNITIRTQAITTIFVSQKSPVSHLDDADSIKKSPYEDNGRSSPSSTIPFDDFSSIKFDKHVSAKEQPVKSIRHIMSVYDNLDPNFCSQIITRNVSIPSPDYSNGNVSSICTHSQSPENDDYSYNNECHSSISVGPDHVTHVEIDPNPSYENYSKCDEGFYSQSYYEAIYGNPGRVGLSASPVNRSLFSDSWRNASSSSPNTAMDSQISRSRISHVGRPAKFPIPTDLDMSDSRDKHV